MGKIIKGEHPQNPHTAPNWPGTIDPPTQSRTVTPGDNYAGTALHVDFPLRYSRHETRVPDQLLRESRNNGTMVMKGKSVYRSPESVIREQDSRESSPMAIKSPADRQSFKQYMKTPKRTTLMGDDIGERQIERAPGIIRGAVNPPPGTPKKKR